jgi:hypothetical protein
MKTVSFPPFFSNIGEKPAFQKADFSATFFATVQESRLRILHVSENCVALFLVEMVLADEVAPRGTSCL